MIHRLVSALIPAVLVEDVHLIGEVQSRVGERLRIELPVGYRLVDWRHTPSIGTLRSGQTVILDLIDDTSILLARDWLARALDQCDVWILVRAAGTLSCIMTAFSRTNVHVMLCNLQERTAGCPAAIGDITRSLGRVLPDAMVRYVIAAEPLLGSVRGIVEAICGDLIRVRRPRDVALACHMTLGGIREQSKSLGFSRIEHLIVCVRLIALQQIQIRGGLTNSAATRLFGWNDASNVRKQLGRAKGGSYEAVMHLTSLHQGI